MLVSKSTVDLRSCSRSGLLAGKLFCQGGEKSHMLGDESGPYCPGGETEAQQCLTRYMERSMRRELCSWSRSLTKRSFCRETPRGRVNVGMEVGAAPSPLLSLTSTLLASAFQPRKPGVLWEEVRLPQSRSFPKSVSSIFFPFRKEKPFVVKRWVFWSSSPPPCACFCPLQLHGIGAAWS